MVGADPVRRTFEPPLIALLLCLGACEGKTSSVAERDIRREASPDGHIPVFGGKTLAGDAVSLADHRGKVILLNIWATWCTPCRQELPELQNLHRTLGDQGFTVIGVSVDKPAALPRARALVSELGLTYPNIFDPDGRAVEAFDVAGYPTSFIIGRDGKMRWRRDGLIRPEDDEVESELEAALAEPKPAG